MTLPDPHGLGDRAAELSAILATASRKRSKYTFRDNAVRAANCSNPIVLGADGFWRWLPVSAEGWDKLSPVDQAQVCETYGFTMRNHGRGTQWNVLI